MERADMDQLNIRVQMQVRYPFPDAFPHFSRACYRIGDHADLFRQNTVLQKFRDMLHHAGRLSGTRSGNDIKRTLFPVNDDFLFVAELNIRRSASCRNHGNRHRRIGVMADFLIPAPLAFFFRNLFRFKPFLHFLHSGLHFRIQRIPVVHRQHIVSEKVRVQCSTAVRIFSKKAVLRGNSLSFGSLGSAKKDEAVQGKCSEQFVRLAAFCILGFPNVEFHYNQR